MEPKVLRIFQLFLASTNLAIHYSHVVDSPGFGDDELIINMITIKYEPRGNIFALMEIIIIWIALIGFLLFISMTTLITITTGNKPKGKCMIFYNVVGAVLYVISALALLLPTTYSSIVIMLAVSTASVLVLTMLMDAIDEIIPISVIHANNN